ncbi:S-adenosyl-L-methionine-dependent methyltransferase [Mycena galopus ATCC 62051]|nr:S-adenosyl-L-methionine-dependent methyltransferase [Mycena galopus ATCC 62051]
MRASFGLLCRVGRRRDESFPFFHALSFFLWAGALCVTHCGSVYVSCFLFKRNRFPGFWVRVFLPNSLRNQFEKVTTNVRTIFDHLHLAATYWIRHHYPIRRLIINDFRMTRNLSLHAPHNNGHSILSVPAHELKSHIASTYNAIAPQYNAWTASHQDFRLDYLNQLLPHLPSSGARILELGAGAGGPATALLAALSEAHIVANDISSAQLSLLRARHASEVSAGKLETREGDMMDLAFSDGALDAVVGLYSIIHLPREEQKELLRKIGRWVKGGGWLLVNFAGKEIEGLVQMGWLEEKQEGKESQNAMYWSSWGPAESRRFVQEAGFRIEVEEIGGKEGPDVDFFWVLAQKIE